MPGGPSLYSARTAAALGAHVTLVTTLAPGYDRAVLEGLTLAAVPAARTTRYENRYDAAGARTQFLLDEGEPLAADTSAIAEADALIVAPAYHELSAPPAVAARVYSLALQGLLRTRGEGNRVAPHPDPWAQTEPFVRAGGFAFLSVEDTPAADALAAKLAAAGMVAFVTRGPGGAARFEGVARHELAAFPAECVEPTGAGDCFATAFTVRFAETGDIEAASRFALAAGALAVEAHGLTAIPSRAAIDARLRKVAA